MSFRRPSLTVAACLAATWFGWGSSYLAIKFALASFPPFFQGGTRFLVAGGLLMAWAWQRGRELPTLIEWRNAAIVGTVMLGGIMAGVTYAEQSVASGLVVAVMAINPALITLASRAFGVRPSGLDVLGIVIGITGVLLLIRGTGFSSSPLGVIAIAIAVVGWSTGSVLSQYVFPLALASAGFASTMLCAGVFLLGLSVAAGEAFHWPPQPLAAAAWLYLIFIGSLTAFTAYMVLLAGTSAALASTWTFVSPVIGVLLGVSWGGETMTPHEWVAVAVIVAGVATITVGRTGWARSLGPFMANRWAPRRPPA
jgi:drug/metabolite transporter (DMT)-like permease